MGAHEMPRARFLAKLARLAAEPAPQDWPRVRAPVRMLL
jgi:hypothetical protein